MLRKSILIVLGVLLWPRHAAAQPVRYVDNLTSCATLLPCYSRIMEAVDASARADVIEVFAGVYVESIVLSEKGGLVLKAHDEALKPVIVAPAGQNAIHVVASPDVRVLNFIIEAPEARAISTLGLGASGIAIQGNVIKAGGIHMWHMVGCTIRDNTILGSGISLPMIGNGCLIEGNRLIDAGISIGGGENVVGNVIRDNVLVRGGIGLGGRPTRGNIVESNRLHGGGIVIGGSQVTENVIRRNVVRGGGSIGLRRDVTGNTIDSNVVSGSGGDGIWVQVISGSPGGANHVHGNTSVENAGCDLRDFGGGVLENLWSENRFGTSCGDVTSECSAPLALHRDGDGDGYGAPLANQICGSPPGYVADGSDCDDSQAAIHPGMPESCNGIDDDCDGVIDESLPVNGPTWYRDYDGDGYGDPLAAIQTCAAPMGYVTLAGDCNDRSASARPGAAERCNGSDDDCDGAIDEHLGASTCGTGACTRTTDNCAGGTLQACASGPPAVETCNGIDDDCDGLVDDAAGEPGDTDGDGFAGACDNCPTTTNVSQDDSNFDGSGDACQPALAISGIHQDGGEKLYVAALATDGQDDGLSWSFDVQANDESAVVLQDLGHSYDCGLAYLPDGVPDEGIGFAFGSIGEPVLVDVHGTIGCGDGRRTYELALGACDAPRSEFTQSLSLSGVVPPATVCLRRFGASDAGRNLTIVDMTRESLRLSFVTITEALKLPFAAGTPRPIDISLLSRGTAYTLRIRVTDGNTVPVEAQTSFVSRGETALIIDTPPRAVIAASETTVECSGPAGGFVTFDASGSHDPDSTPGTNDDIATFEWFENYGLPAQVLLGTGKRHTAALPLGSHSVSLRVTDSPGLTATIGTVVVVVDTRAPSLELALSPTVLWPPNRRMVPVQATWHVDDACDPAPRVDLASATSSEPDSAAISRIASPGTAGASVVLRAERSGDGAGRVYTLIWTATDASGNNASEIGLVTVPHHR